MRCARSEVRLVDAMEARGAMLWTTREGKIVRGKMFQTKDEALEAAGLSEFDAHADA
jgi:ketosteroid isomerase-like protein